jgi:Cu/Zn superoxide dismutase
MSVCARWCIFVSHPQTHVYSSTDFFLTIILFLLLFSRPTVHGTDGSRVACGILQKTTENVLKTETQPLGDSKVTSDITVHADSESTTRKIGEAGDVCFFGKAYGLESNLVSFLANPAGPNCLAGNGCGAHVHSGTACTTSTTQGGHFYSETVIDDPWALEGYLTTDEDGNAVFFDCVTTGEYDFVGRAFVVHADDGSRVSCGLLMPEPVETASPTAAPTSSVGKLSPLQSALTMLTTAMVAVTF